MFTDYKTPRIKQRENGSWAVLFRIYEGEITTEDELDNDGNLQPVTRYRRTALLHVKELSFPVMPGI